MIRSQPRAWASKTSASSRGLSEPCALRYSVVQVSKRRTVHDSGIVDLLIEYAHLIPQFVAIVLDEGVGDGLQVAANDLIELVDREADAVIGDAILRKVVGANL